MISFGKSNVCSKQLLTNLEDEIFLKGGSVVTPKKFDLVLFIKMLPGNKTFPFLSSFTFCDFGFLPLVGKKTFKKYFLDLNTLFYKTIPHQWI